MTKDYSRAEQRLQRDPEAIEKLFSEHIRTGYHKALTITEVSHRFDQ